jgi:hypothetical protein
MPGLEIEEAAAILKILPALNRSCAAQTVHSQGFTGEVTPLSGAQQGCRISTERCSALMHCFFIGGLRHGQIPLHGKNERQERQ